MNLVPFLLAMLAGFAFIYVPVDGTFLAGLSTLLDVVGILTVIVFSSVIVVKAILILFNRNIGS